MGINSPALDDLGRALQTGNIEQAKTLLQNIMQTRTASPPYRQVQQDAAGTASSVPTLIGTRIDTSA
ncbi:hypothetical protein [Paludibacterium yongneupense]|uniref:hypothetical protein n=1 Tax=Paludibacterium yongneupense TaxID=400061 RepID=UPI000405350B|nr:hypothetical protein [Paludibacterium yongneupense]